MKGEQDWSITTVIALLGSLGAVATIPGGFLLAAEVQNYSDVEADYWAQPFIQQLTQANILTGYPDGTFRPEQAIDRDEYAAVIRQAFEAKPVRAIPQGSAFQDVPDGYWASEAIEEAYETGFMGTPDADEFEPRTQITRADAIVALVKGLGLSETAQAAEVVAIPAAAEPVQPVRRKRKVPNQFMFPLASTTVMQLFASPIQAVSSAQPAAAQNSAVSPDAGAEVPLDLSDYYADADQIPDYARDEVALATQNGLIVNYPNVSLLNPNQPISRGGTAALVYQALVYQNSVEPLSETSDGSNYIVGR